MLSGSSYNHGKTVRHGDKVSTASLGPLLPQIAESRGTKWVLRSGNAILVVLEAELASIFTDDRDVVPSKPGESLAGDFTKRRREINKVDSREEFRDIDVLAHGFNVPASTAADLFLS